MIVDVVQESQPDLADYASVPIAFEVREVMRITAGPPESGRHVLTARAVTPPWWKDYDASDGGPASWATQFDLSYWTFFAARANGARVGSASVVFRAPDMDMLGGRTDIAILWDIRVAPAARGNGVGSALVAAVEAWATACGAEWLEVEAQDINAPACRFYARHGFELRATDPDAYPDLPNEMQLLWYKRLRRLSFRAK